MNCPHCGQTVEATDTYCSSCGQAVDASQRRAQPRGFEMVCLMSGVPLTNELRQELYKTACEMGRKNCEKKVFQHPDFECTLTTDFSYSSFNSMGGVKFTAEIEGDTVKGKVVFLITNFDYTEDGIWLPVIPVPKSHPAAKAQYN